MRSLLELPPDYIRPEWRDCPVPGRPWWRWATHRPGSINRRDGAQLLDIMQDTRGTLPHPATPRVYPGDLQKAADRDAEDPIAHPGFRAGDLWLALTSTGLWSRVLCDGDAEWLREDRERKGDVACFGNDATSVFLIASLARPDLAPWSSP